MNKRKEKVMFCKNKCFVCVTCKLNIKHYQRISERMQQKKFTTPYAWLQTINKLRGK